MVAFTNLPSSFFFFQIASNCFFLIFPRLHHRILNCFAHVFHFILKVGNPLAHFIRQGRALQFDWCELTAQQINYCLIVRHFASNNECLITISAPSSAFSCFFIIKKKKVLTVTFHLTFNSHTHTHFVDFCFGSSFCLREQLRVHWIAGAGHACTSFASRWTHVRMSVTGFIWFIGRELEIFRLCVPLCNEQRLSYFVRGRQHIEYCAYFLYASKKWRQTADVELNWRQAFANAMKVYVLHFPETCNDNQHLL